MLAASDEECYHLFFLVFFFSPGTLNVLFHAFERIPRGFFFLCNFGGDKQEEKMKLCVLFPMPRLFVTSLFSCSLADINECDEGPPVNTCTELEECTNVPGTFHCSCRSGYHHDKDACVGEWSPQDFQQHTAAHRTSSFLFCRLGEVL